MVAPTKLHLIYRLTINIFAPCLIKHDTSDKQNIYLASRTKIYNSWRSWAATTFCHLSPSVKIGNQKICCYNLTLFTFKQYLIPSIVFTMIKSWLKMRGKIWDICIALLGKPQACEVYKKIGEKKWVGQRGGWQNLLGWFTFTYSILKSRRR